MALVFQGGLAIPLWAIAFFTVALTAPPTATLFLMPPTTVFAIAAVGIAAIALDTRFDFVVAHVSRTCSRHPIQTPRSGGCAMTVSAGAGVRTLDELNRSAANDALDLSRMDDDGGWRMARPQA